MSEKQAKERMVQPEDLPVAGQDPMPVEEPAPQQEGRPKQVTLDAYCRKVSNRVPPETLSVFYTREMSGDNLQAPFEEFEKRLQDFMMAPLG